MTDVQPALGAFGRFGGRYVPETLTPALEELDDARRQHLHDDAFARDLQRLHTDLGGRPTPVYEADGFRRLAASHRNPLADDPGDAPRILLKREDLVHGGAHKFNNVVGQALLADRMGKRRVIAETGAGQHGVATAMACANLGLDCIVYMGTVDMERQDLNVARMRMLGAEVRGVDAGSATLKDAVNEALRDWVTHVETTHYCLGSVVGPHPYPVLVRDLQRVIGDELRAQVLHREDRLPDALVACVGGGSNAIGTFVPFVDDEHVDLVGVEAGGDGVTTDRHAATLTGGSPGVLHGAMSFLLQDDDGQVQEAHSVSAGLDYPGVGPEHAHLHDTGRATYTSVTDDEALAAARALAMSEGILPALEPAHALAHVLRDAPHRDPDDLVVVTLSGRGDKDVPTFRREGIA